MHFPILWPLIYVAIELIIDNVVVATDIAQIVTTGTPMFLQSVKINTSQEWGERMVQRENWGGLEAIAHYLNRPKAIITVHYDFKFSKEFAIELFHD